MTKKKAKANRRVPLRRHEVAAMPAFCPRLTMPVAVTDEAVVFSVVLHEERQ